jgi:hypothetical protein
MVVTGLRWRREVREILVVREEKTTKKTSFRPRTDDHIHQW